MTRRRLPKKSPLKDKPLRNPGQSLSGQAHDLAYGKMLLWLVIAAMMVALAVCEWFRWAFDTPPYPISATAFAMLACALAAWQVRRLMPLLRNTLQGVAGEKVVGQLLEGLRSQGYEVFHDIVGDGHNIDHALVGPGGVFAIETKTIRKPIRGDAQVVFDGESLRVDGMKPDRDPIVQVKAAARELAMIIRESSGRDLFVRPVVLYPGWFTRQPKRPQIWVLNENAFPKFLGNEDARFSVEEVKNIASGIAMHVRGIQRK